MARMLCFHRSHSFLREGANLAAGILAVVVLGSCGKQPAAEVADDASVVLPAAGLVAESVSLSGRVILLGGPPPSVGQKVDVGGNPFCTSHGDIIDPTWKLHSDGGLGDVVITVAGSPRASNLPAEPSLIDQKNCQYLPTVSAVQAGQSIAVRNSDLTYHNVRLIRHRVGTADQGENLVNIAQAGSGETWVRELRKAGVYRLECDIHRWMRAWVVVHEGAHHAVTGSDGRYVMNRALPDGEYEVRAWHPRFKVALSKMVQVVNGTAEVDFAFDFSRSFDAARTLDS